MFFTKITDIINPVVKNMNEKNMFDEKPKNVTIGIATAGPITNQIICAIFKIS